jgi:hypothetical protein
MSCATPTITFSNVEFIMNCVELNPQAMDIVLKANSFLFELMP